LNKDGEWIGEECIQPTKKIDNHNSPSQIHDLNSQIIQHTFGFRLQKFGKIRTKVGYRYIRKKEDGLRLEREDLFDKLIIHNYGHGGAGVTLSWGCAQQVLRLLEHA